MGNWLRSDKSEARKPDERIRNVAPPADSSVTEQVPKTHNPLLKMLYVAAAILLLLGLFYYRCRGKLNRDKRAPVFKKSPRMVRGGLNPVKALSYDSYSSDKTKRQDGGNANHNLQPILETELFQPVRPSGKGVEQLNQAQVEVKNWKLEFRTSDRKINAVNQKGLVCNHPMANFKRQQDVPDHRVSEFGTFRTEREVNSVNLKGLVCNHPMAGFKRQQRDL